jgi:hypothetical protein
MKIRNHISRAVNSALLLSLPLLGGHVQAVSFEDTASPVYQTQSSGSGWKLVSIPTSSFTGTDYTPPASPLPTQSFGLVSDSTTAVYMIESLAGLNASPLSAALKQDLAAEFGGTAAFSKTTSGLQIDSAVGLVSSGFNSPVIFVHKGVVDAMAKGTEQAEYGTFVQSEAVEQSLFGCGGKWYAKSKNGSFNLSNVAGQKVVARSGGFTGSIGADLPLNGKIDYTFGYSYRANKCLGIPYAVRFDNIHAKGDLNLNNSQLSIDGTISYKTSWTSEKTYLVNKSWHFFIGPIPVILGLNVPYFFGYDVNSSLTGSVSLANTGTGVYSFDYTCTSNNCNGTNNSTVQFQNGTNAPRASAAVNIGIKPYFAIEAVGYLYTESFLSAGLGSEISVPSTLWGYYGNACGDADGDGSTETVKSLVLDVNAQLALYGKWKVFGNQNWAWLDSKFSIAGWDLFKVSDYTTRNKAPFYALRRNLIFREFESAATSALTPVIVGPSSIAASGSGYSAMMRSCVPFDDKMNYVFDWGDSTTTAFSGDGAQQTFQAHNWATTGAKNLKLTAQSDVIHRNYGVSTVRPITVVTLPAPGVPGGITAPAVSGSSLTLSWTAGSGSAQTYQLQQQANLGTWVTVRTQSGVSATLTGLAIGAYNYRVRACNTTGCSNYTENVAVSVAPLPAATTLTVSSEFCGGLNDAEWTAVSGATSYQIYMSSTNSSGTANLAFTTSGLYRFLRVTSNQYVWVKACTGAACSTFSNSGLARYVAGVCR